MSGFLAAVVPPPGRHDPLDDYTMRNHAPVVEMRAVRCDLRPADQAAMIRGAARARARVDQQIRAAGGAILAEES